MNGLWKTGGCGANRSGAELENPMRCLTYRDFNTTFLNNPSPGLLHYSGGIVSTMASQINSITIVYSTVCSGADQIKHQSSASLAFVRWIRRLPANSPHKGPVTRKMFPFDAVIMFIGSKQCLITQSLVMRHCSKAILQLPQYQWIYFTTGIKRACGHIWQAKLIMYD